MSQDKNLIIQTFRSNLKGKFFTKKSGEHDGAEGHWVEELMGVKKNNLNRPDLLGFECKKQSPKTSFGDWQADISLWGTNTPYPSIKQLDRDKEFLEYFGKPNEEKDGRFAWSGMAPKINKYNDFGQILEVDRNNNIFAYYSFLKDSRPNKIQIVPKHLQIENLILCEWTNLKLQKTVENKFNQAGFFICEKDKSGVYTSIAFGPPINYNQWIKQVKLGVIFFDSGMHQGNKRPYASWRANKKYWDNLITDRYQ